ncbi:hypothetical protein E4T39_08784 [Aureobasidium subglaciale]|nr:hypothetical protein E4T39_08784 [Aureobasidium subglaciale]
MKDSRLYEANFDITHRRLNHLSIDTTAFLGQSSLISPPESANSARRSSYDMSFHTPASMPHPNTPVHFSSHDMYNVAPTEKMKLSLNQYPPSPVDFKQSQQSYGTTACNSPTWNSSMAFDQKAGADGSFYQESSTLLSADQDWNSSTMSHYPNVDYLPDPTSLYMLPSHEPSASFMSDVDSSHHDSLPAFIAPNQAVHQPEMDYNMGISGWGLQTPVHDHSVLHSSSPPEYSPMTPSNLDCSFDNSYAKIEASPSASLLSHSRSTLSKKGRKMSKLDKRRSICKNVPVTDSDTSITLLTDEKSETFRQNKYNPDRKMHECGHCKQKFQRSEHCKRHEQSHLDEHPYECYIATTPLDPSDPTSTCKVGKKGKGSQNRRDNSRSHHWTHLKAWMAANDPLVREPNRAQGKCNRGRNKAVGPVRYYELIRSKDTVQQQEIVLRFLNQEAGKEFGAHVLWEVEGCPVVACRGGAGQAEGCGMCRSGKAGSKKK